MEAIVLAGGKGTRLGDLTKQAPKPMLLVSGRPFLEYVLDYLIEQGMQEVVFSVGYMQERILAHFGGKYRGVGLKYAVEREPLGTGGGIRHALEQCVKDEVFVLNGDTLFRVPLVSMQKLHRKHDALLTIALRRVPDISRYGSVRIQNDRITAFDEKQAEGEGLINGGVYLVNRQKALERLPPGVSSFESEFIGKSIRSEVVCGMPSEAYFIDIGVPEEYERANKTLAEVVDGAVK